MREAELRVRGPGSSGSRPAVQPDAEGGRPDPGGGNTAKNGKREKNRRKEEATHIFQTPPERHLRPGPELEKIRREVAEYQRFRNLVGQVTEVNEAICDARPVTPGGAGDEGPSGTGGEKRGS